MITLAPNEPTPADRDAMLALAVRMHAEAKQAFSRLPIDGDPSPRYVLVWGEGDRAPFVWPADPATEEELQQLVAQVRRVVHRTKPQLVAKLWSAYRRADGAKKPAEVFLIHLETAAGALAIGEASVRRFSNHPHPRLGPLKLTIFEESDVVDLRHGGGFFLDAMRGHCRTPVH